MQSNGYEVYLHITVIDLDELWVKERCRQECAYPSQIPVTPPQARVSCQNTCLQVFTLLSNQGSGYGQNNSRCGNNRTC